MCVRMAEGVGNAAVVVPFMTEKYESSTNCKLELKFSQQVGRDSDSFCSHISLRLANELRHVGFLVQTGVPIVPVLMQPDYAPAGWLGLLTGALFSTHIQFTQYETQRSPSLTSRASTPGCTLSSQLGPCGRRCTTRHQSRTALTA